MSIKQKSGISWTGLLFGVLVAVLIVGVLTWFQPDDKPRAAKPRTRSLTKIEREERVSRVRPGVSHFRSDESSWSERMRHLSEVKGDLSIREQRILISHLKKFGSHGSRDAHHFNALLNLLHRQEKLAPNLTNELIALVESSEQPELIQRYSFQHLRLLWNRNNSKNQRSIEEAIQGQLEGDFNATQGAALLSLHQIAPLSTDVSVASVAEIAEQWLASSTRTPADHLVALRVLRESKHVGAAAQIRELVSAPEAPVALKLGALAALGELGNLSDFSLLESLTAEESVYSLAAKNALLQLNETDESIEG